MKTNKRKRKAKLLKVKQLKPFGDDSMANQYGYDIGLILGWFEDMVWCEDDGDYDPDSPKGKRLAHAYEALEHMQAIYDMEPEPKD
jgi:hypothetical protein